MEIERCLNDGSLVISPFEGSCLNGAGYDLRLSGDLAMSPGVHKLVATLERVEIGEVLVGTLYLRSTLARSGIIASLALVDPGFSRSTNGFTLQRGVQPIQYGEE